VLAFWVSLLSYNLLQPSAANPEIVVLLILVASVLPSVENRHAKFPFMVNLIKPFLFTANHSIDDVCTSEAQYAYKIHKHLKIFV
jgi:hypothetical protein